MLQIRLALILIILASAGGGYWYVQKLQKDNAILKSNQVKLETAVAESNQVIEQQSKDLKKIRSTLKEVEELMKEVREYNKDLESNVAWLALNKIDLLDEEEVNKLVKQLELKYKNKLKVSSISAAQRKGTKELMRDIGRYLESNNE